MGWSFRRSKKLGPFRLNFSKKGVGVSVGVPGARVTVGADGRVTQTLGFPGTGLRFQQTALAGAAARRTIARPLPYHPGRPAKAGSVPMSIGCFGSVVLSAVVMVMSVSAAKSGSWLAAAGMWSTILVFMVPIGLVLWSRAAADRETDTRFSLYIQGLIDRFGEEKARLLVVGDPWQGASEEMISIMLGSPEDVATRVHKHVTAETWKYQAIAKNRYALRVEFENGLCVGWQTA